MLRAAVMHRGATVGSGHYVCYARQKNGIFCMYNDSDDVQKNVMEGLANEVFTDARFFLYENETQ